MFIVIKRVPGEGQVTSRKHPKSPHMQQPEQHTRQNVHFPFSNKAMCNSNRNMTDEQVTARKEEPTDTSVGSSSTHTTGKPWQSQPNLLST